MGLIFSSLLNNVYAFTSKHLQSCSQEQRDSQSTVFWGCTYSFYKVFISTIYLKLDPSLSCISHACLQCIIGEWINKSTFNEIDISITNTNKTPLLVHVPCAHKLYRTFHILYSTYSTVWKHLFLKCAAILQENLQPN